ncbi:MULTISPECIES: MazG nucleotide pyrophosphohydrolase domain-containing protein [Lacrimispora]|jgi:tetrapyrrole methylase family protein/MazG family protein|uniref:MazG nucleotide pyrophosphohydrolase domain-containing protein n=1 Tax=Lacrimispora TaxID=2719231 RepID=UPI0004466C30|nr:MULTISPECIES: MazG nucleotide pyrophosphohydrolase domain-containing protein [Lacrimispora]EXG83956.1 protein with tetrapyrrole methyltransferase and pyrophosphatase domains [Clostridium sp. ASBs410]MDR7812188.1 MazG nucleotide pyrophosphohydrolase domain-containing protein [Lacrimispora sp.]SET83165.1 tetrapyrrole methylase family protein / MazG family protein [Lacrimispora sphenoides]
MYTFEDLVNITNKLRSEKGCSWDREQTYESLKKCLEEESREVLNAIDHEDMENLCEELGDILFLVMLYSQIAKERGDFSTDDVVNGICKKMIRRHPHVFGGENAGLQLEGQALWEAIKKQEKALQKCEKP